MIICFFLCLICIDKIISKRKTLDSYFKSKEKNQILTGISSLDNQISELISHVMNIDQTQSSHSSLRSFKYEINLGKFTPPTIRFHFLV